MRTIKFIDFKNYTNTFSQDDDRYVYRIYAIRCDGCYLYIGKSNDAIRRIEEHFWGTQAIDHLLRRGGLARRFEIDLYTEKDICEFLRNRCSYNNIPSDKECDLRKEESLYRFTTKTIRFEEMSSREICEYDQKYKAAVFLSPIMDALVTEFESIMIFENSPVYNFIGTNSDNHENSDRWYSLHPELM